MADTQLPIVIPTACIGLQFVRAREDSMIVRAAYGSYELATQRIYKLGDAQRVLVPVTKLALYVEPKSVHLSII